MLGQLCKDMVAIPSGANIDDCRIQFLWLQTSGTGKSTLSNLVDCVFNVILNLDQI